MMDVKRSVDNEGEQQVIAQMRQAKERKLVVEKQLNKMMLEQHLKPKKIDNNSKGLKREKVND